MKSSISIVLGSIIIGASIISGSVIMSSEVMTAEEDSAPQVINDQGRVLMTVEETAQYLNLSEEDVMTIINTEKKRLERSGSFTGEMFPYFILNDEIYISREGITNWLIDVSRQKREYINGDLLY